VRQARLGHDRESHAEIDGIRAELTRAIGGLVHPAQLGPRGPEHCAHCGARVGAPARAAHEAAAHPEVDTRLRELVARLNSLDDHWDYLDLSRRGGFLHW
jgi:hypothetical protein